MPPASTVQLVCVRERLRHNSYPWCLLRCKPLLQAEENLPSGCKMYTMPDVISLGQKSPVPGPVIPGKDGHSDNPIFSLFYTSGSTGLPKGAIYREKMW